MVFLGHLLTATIKFILIGVVALGGVFLGKFLRDKKSSRA